jgi:hypothetical protein
MLGELEQAMQAGQAVPLWLDKLRAPANLAAGGLGCDLLSVAEMKIGVRHYGARAASCCWRA